MGIARRSKRGNNVDTGPFRFSTMQLDLAWQTVACNLAPWGWYCEESGAEQSFPREEREKLKMREQIREGWLVGGKKRRKQEKRCYGDFSAKESGNSRGRKTEMSPASTCGSPFID